MKTDKLTAKEISLWIDNDELLYHWHKDWRRSNRGLKRSDFIRENRDKLESHVRKQLDRKPVD